jgi:hypothetical protein
VPSLSGDAPLWIEFRRRPGQGDSSTSGDGKAPALLGGLLQRGAYEGRSVWVPGSPLAAFLALGSWNLALAIQAVRAMLYGTLAFSEVLAAPRSSGGWGKRWC